MFNDFSVFPFLIWQGAVDMPQQTTSGFRVRKNLDRRKKKEEYLSFDRASFLKRSKLRMREESTLKSKIITCTRFFRC